MESLPGYAYHIRFRTDTNTINLTKDNLKEFPQRSFFDNKYIPNKTFFDKDMTIIWFEAKLSFPPQIGWTIDCEAEGFDWNEDIYPMVGAVTFRMKLNVFDVELDWGLSNHLNLIRKLEKSR